jgi:hypothetical protein
MKINGFTDLCAPAYVYLAISTMAITVMALQNIYGGSRHFYCLGAYSCEVPSVWIIFLIKTLYVLFWTWVLNLLCSYGYAPLSWFLVLLPFILFFILLAYMFIYPSSYA